MKQDNIFRFVSIRPPSLISNEDKRFINDSEVSSAVADKIDQLARNTDKNHEEARLEVGKSIIYSDNYYLKTNAWVKWQPASSQIKEIVNSSKHGIDYDEFKNSVHILLENILGESLSVNKFSQSNHFKKLKETIWKSYCGNIINPYLRPQDQSELLSWIRFLYLIESISTREVFEKIATTLLKTRPVVPDVLFVDKTTTVTEDLEVTPQLPTSEEEKIENIRAEINLLRKIIKFLEQIYQAKRKEFRINIERNLRFIEPRKPKPQTTKGSDKAKKVQPLKEASPIILTEAENKLMKEPPWRINENDFVKHPQFRKLLQKLQINIDSSAISDVTSRVENEVAVLIGNLADIKKQKETLVIGRMAATIMKHRRQ